VKKKCKSWGWEEIVDKPTRERSILDLCFTSMPSLVQNIEVLAGISDHDIVAIDTLIKPFRSRPVKRKVYPSYNKADVDGLNQALADFGNSLTEEKVNESSVEDLWRDFKSVLFTSMDKFIPSKMTSSNHNLPWVDASIRRAVRRKQRLITELEKLVVQPCGKNSKNSAA
jgi:hypothetical protein